MKSSRRQKVLNHFVGLLLFAFIFLNALSAFAVPGKTTYQAKIVKPDGYPLEASSVNFKFTILDPIGSCILYSETYSSVNMSSTGGLISFALGSGVKTYPASATTFEQVFSNITPSLSCDTGGPANYTPTATDIRKIVMQFHDGSGWQTLPAMSINAVPYAMYANEATKLNGLQASDFVQLSIVPTCATSEALRYTGAGFTCVAVGSSVTSGTVVTALGYTPADSVSLTTVTANVSSVSSTVFSVSSTVTSLQSSVAASFAAITSSQWITSGTNIFYNTGNIGVGTTTPVTKLDVSGGVRIGAESTTCAPALAGTLRYNASNVEYCNGTSWQAFGVSGSGITNFNGSTSGTQSFANATGGTAPNIVTANGVHTLNIPLASAGSVTAGLISNTDYTTFANKITSSAASIAQVLGYVPADNAASGTYAQKANNLSDLTNIATARTNLGLGALAVGNSIDLGSASATGIIADARLANQSGVTSGSQYTKVIVDSKGRVTSGAQLSSSDVTTALGYTPANSATIISSQWSTLGTTINYMNGSVGIGTTTPSGRLAIESTAAQNSTALYIYRDSVATGVSTTQRGIYIYQNGSNDSTINEGIYVNAVHNVGNNATGINANASTVYAEGIALAGNATKSDGAGPGNVYGVKATATAVGANTLSSVYAGYFSNTATSGSSLYGVYISNAVSGANNYGLYQAGGTQNYFSGNVGIGTTTPVTKLDVLGGVRIGAESTTCAPALAGTLRYNASNVEYCNGTSWQAFGVSGAGITNFNGSTSGTQSFATGSGGTAPAFNTSNGVHTLNLPLASTGSVTAGLISNTDYTTFTNKITSSAASIAQVLGYVPADNAASGTYAQKANNLSDLTNVATARTNLGLGTFAIASSIDLGSASATGTLAVARLPSFSGDATIAAASNTIILSNSGVTAGTYTKVTVDSKGRVTSSSTLASSDVTTALGYTPASATASTQWTTSGSAIYYNTGNVGIGTTNPAEKLDVNGNIHIYDSTAGGGYSVLFDAANGPGIRSVGSAYRQIFMKYASTDVINYNADLNRTYLGGGNVGIGTTEPTAKLHLSAGTSSNAPLKLTSGTLLTSPQSGTMEYDGTNFYLTDSTNTRRAIAANTNPGTYDNVSNINSSSNITMTPTGSVVVSSTTASTNSSTGALVVNGGLGVASNLNVAGTISGSAKVIATGFRANQGAPDAADNSTNGYAFGSDGDTGMFSPGSGAANGVLAFYGNNAELVRITASGAVGIGTSTPTAPIEAAKNFGASGAANSVLKLNARGTASSGFGGSIDFLSSNEIAQNDFIAARISSAWEVADNGFGLSFFTKNTGANGGATAERMRISNSGYVGIGTTAPASRLHVGLAGTESVQLGSFKIVENWAMEYWSQGYKFMTINAGVADVAFLGTVSAGGNGFAHADAKFKQATVIGGSAGGTLISGYDGIQLDNTSFYGAPTTFSFAGVEKVRIASTGNVGIGTTNPGTELQVYKTKTGVTTISVGNSVSSTNDGASLQLLYGATEIGSYNYYWTGSQFQNRLNYYGDLAFTNQGVEKARITSTGNVGIGTTNPNSQFKILGASGLTFGDFNAYTGTTTNANNLAAGADHPLIAPNNIKPQLVLRSGTYTIGDPNSALTYRGGLAVGEGVGIYSLNPNPGGSPYYGDLRFYTSVWNGSGYNIIDRLNITMDGNVGIGTTSPASKLEVNGQIAGKSYKTRLFQAGGRSSTSCTLSASNTTMADQFCDLSVTFTLTDPASAQINYTIAMSAGSSGGRHLVTGIDIDGTVVTTVLTGITSQEATPYWSNSQTHFADLATGSHTIKVKYRTPAGGTSNPSANDWENRILQVMILGYQ